MGVKFATPTREERWELLMEAIDVQITPYPEVIATGRVMSCGECDGAGRIEDAGPGLARIPYPVMRECPICAGRGRFPQFTQYDESRMW